MRVSVIIPTRNRAEALAMTLRSLLAQDRRADEIIIVDASDADGNAKVQEEFSSPGIVWLYSTPSVCWQRNQGIEAASGDWIFLCDDDIELMPDYLSRLIEYAERHPHCGAIAGRLLQCEAGQWVDQYPVGSFGELAWRFVFQLPIWGSIDGFRVPLVARPLYRFMRKFYRMRRNTLTLAGWPLITDWAQPVFRSTVYSLGANLIRKDWLMTAKYDETLDPSGIGDNYGVALQFPEGESIHVLALTSARHHRAAENRLSRPLVYYRRLLALHYFILKFRPNVATRVWFIWSLLGNALIFLYKGDREMALATKKAISIAIASDNPYWRAALRREKGVSPQYAHP